MTHKGTRVHVYLDDESLAALDAQRGVATRSAYLRLLLTHDTHHKTSGDLAPIPVVAPPTGYQDTEPPVPVAHGEPPHRHRPPTGGPTTVTIKGVRYSGYTCECGEVITR
jgi:hypothetical protein